MFMLHPIKKRKTFVRKILCMFIYVSNTFLFHLKITFAVLTFSAMQFSAFQKYLCVAAQVNRKDKTQYLGKINLIDLAGSENVNKSGVQGGKIAVGG